MSLKLLLGPAGPATVVAVHDTRPTRMARDSLGATLVVENSPAQCSLVRLSKMSVQFLRRPAQLQTHVWTKTSRSLAPKSRRTSFVLVSSATMHSCKLQQSPRGQHPADCVISTVAAGRHGQCHQVSRCCTNRRSQSDLHSVMSREDSEQRPQLPDNILVIWIHS